MRRVTIRTNYVGLVFRKRKLTAVLNEGSYWLSLFESVELYDRSEPFVAFGMDLDVLLLNADFVRETILLTAADNELILVFQNGNFRQVLGPGRHVYWKGLSGYSFETFDLSRIEIEDAIDRNLLARPELMKYVRVCKVESFEQALLMVDGKLAKTLGAGTYYFWKNSTPVDVMKADMRQLNLEIAGQEILTRDKAQLRINFSVQYRVTDLLKARLETQDFEKQLYVAMQLALRECVGQMTFDELMESKETVAGLVMTLVPGSVARLGVEVLSCGVKDIILPGDVKDIMNQVLVAEKRAQANSITRREETASTRSLLNTAKLMEDNQMLYKLKEMEYVEKIAEKISSISVSGSGQLVDQLKQIFVK